MQASTPRTGLHFRWLILIRLRSKSRDLTLVIHAKKPLHGCRNVNRLSCLESPHRRVIYTL